MPPVSLAQLTAGVARAKPLKFYKKGVKVRGRGTSYTLQCDPGEDLDFAPYYTPQQMLELGVFSGKYLNDCTGEFPRQWFSTALERGKLRPEQATPEVNLFKIKSRKSLRYWKQKKWIPIIPGDPDKRGWFQWYCRYWLGRRIPALDEKQIARWWSFARHAGQIKASYKRMRSPPRTRAEKRLHRPKQRQALLQWAHNPWV